MTEKKGCFADLHTVAVLISGMFGALRRLPAALGTVARYSHCFYNLRQPSSYIQCTAALQSRSFSSDGMVHISSQMFFIVDKQFSAILAEEIRQEDENSFVCRPPEGFEVDKQDGTSILLKKAFPDGV